MAVRALARLRDERGSTLIEFALVSPMVVMLLMAALEFGLALRANAGLRDLAGAAGREAVVSYQLQSGNNAMGPTILKSYIEDQAKQGKYNLQNGTLTVTVTNTQDSTLLTVNRVNIQLTYKYPLSIPFLNKQTIDMGIDRTFFVPNASTPPPSPSPSTT